MRGRALPLLALLACGWTACPRGPDDIETMRSLAPTAERCRETDRAWNEGPFERATDGGYVYGAGCDEIGGLLHPVAAWARAWCAALADYRGRCRVAGFETGGAK